MLAKAGPQADSDGNGGAETVLMTRDAVVRDRQGRAGQNPSGQKFRDFGIRSWGSSIAAYG